MKDDEGIIITTALEILQTIAVGAILNVIAILVGLAAWLFFGLLGRDFRESPRETVIVTSMVLGFLCLSYLAGFTVLE